MEESISVAVTLEHWKEEILNSFTWINDRRISNGPCEGKNKYETYTMNEHTDRIKRIGNPRGAYKK